MCAPTVNYMQQNCDIATEKLTFECGKSIGAAATNLYQQNLCMTSGILFVTILSTNAFTICCIRNSLLFLPIRKALLVSL